MEFRFSATPNEGGVALPVLPLIPDGAVVWIEGRNGIGKSLSVRLLDLATGGTPYAGDADAWRSLRSSLGTVEIVASGSDLEIEFDLDASGWADNPREQEWDRLGTVAIDGKLASRSEVRSRLRVVRIAGEEGLARAVGNQFLDLASRVSQYADKIAPRAETLDSHLSSALHLLDAGSPRRLEAASAALLDAEETLRLAAVTLLPEAERLGVLDRAIHAAESLAALASQGPALDRKIADLQKELLDAHARRERAVADLSAAAASRPASGATAELVRIERLVARRERAVDRATEDVTDLSVAEHIPPDPRAIASRSEALTANLEAKVAERSDLARSDSIRTFLAELLALLERSDVDNRAVLVEVAGQAITRDVLEDAARARRSSLDRTDVAKAVDATDEDIRQLVERHEVLERLRAALRVLTRKRDLVREALAELGQLEAGLEGAQDAFRRAREQLDGAVADAERITLEKQEAERALAALGEGATQAELREQVAAASEPEDELVAIRDSLRVRVARLEDARDEAQRNVDACQLVYAEAQADSDQSRRALEQEPEWSWLRTGIGVPPEWAPEWVDRAHAAVARARDQVNAAVSDTRAIDAALRDLAQHVSEARPLRPPTRIGDAVIDACEEHVFSEFMTQAIRDALFHGHALDEVDLRNPSVAWSEGGIRIVRPFSAFSSGEQAFAYARARIEQVHRVEHEHLLLVLDEFSAFIAGDRRRLLNRLLNERVRGGAVSQVLLIVPLSQDYVQAARAEGTSASPTLTSRAEEIGRQGYFAEVAPE